MGNNPAAGEDDQAGFHTGLLNGSKTDGKSVIDAMYGADSETAAGIEAIVRDLENYESAAKSERVASGQQQDADVKLSKEAQQQKIRIKKAELTAKDDADIWLKKQMKSKPAEKPQAAVAEEEAPPPPPPLIVLYTGAKAKAKGKAKAKDKAKSGAVPEYYYLLGIDVDATFEEIKKAYRKAALRWHPDKNRGCLEKATEMFKRINEAFDTLFDPEKRANYDTGKAVMKGKVKKLQGHGWADLADEDDATLTVYGWKLKRQSWRDYVFNYGRIDDDPDQLVQDENDPRAPQEKMKVFWRTLGEYAHIEMEQGSSRWLQKFIEKVWKDTPSRWPKGPELQGMNEASQHEWKERRMVFNRRKQKISIWVEMHEAYLNIPNREKKEIERMKKMRPAWIKANDVTFRNEL